jgi:malate dehydrogenase (oxaloacetate-decarboxylating)(NADP+)
MSHTSSSRHRPRPGIPGGAALLRDPLLNKGTAFTDDERQVLGLRGLLPPHVFTLEDQVQRVLENYRRRSNDLERYIHLTTLQDRNETLFYRVVVDNLEELMPIIYTPTVGLACQRFGHIFRRARGLYLSIRDKGCIAEILANLARDDVRAIVVTDGERILGLGDQGASGMGIPIGKLALYTACAGIHPALCLPVTVDVGTENAAYLDDPLYMGLRQRRVRGQEYDDLIAEFMTAAEERWPKALIQFEDIGNTNAFRLLERWRTQARTFNDDIQGTAAVTLAGLLAALRITEQPLCAQRILFLGAGEAGVGIADLIVAAMVEAGAELEAARKSCWFVDSHGLVVRSRQDLAAHKLRYAQDAKPTAGFVAAVRTVEPTAIIGVSTIAKAFDREVIEAMSAQNVRPIIFALSNPTSKSECTAEEAYTWSNDRAVFASGSPFPAVTHAGHALVPGQCNNVYVFPGIALGVMACEASRVVDRMFLAAARTLASRVGPSDLALGRVFPPLARIRELSAHVAVAVARVAFDEGLAAIPEPPDLLAFVRSKMWEPQYDSYLMRHES